VCNLRIFGSGSASHVIDDRMHVGIITCMWASSPVRACSISSQRYSACMWHMCFLVSFDVYGSFLMYVGLFVTCSSHMHAQHLAPTRLSPHQRTRVAVVQKRPICIKWDQKRPKYIKRDPDETEHQKRRMKIKRDVCKSRKRPMYIKRDINTSKETHIKPKRSVSINSDLYTSKETHVKQKRRL